MDHACNQGSGSNQESPPRPPRQRLDFSDDINNAPPSPRQHAHSSTASPIIRIERKLAYERSINHKLLQQIYQMEKKVALLEPDGGGGESLARGSPSCFSSPPVTTPLKKFGRISDDDDNDLSKYIHELEGQQRLETNQRDSIANDSIREKLLDQAFRLISESNNTASTSNTATNGVNLSLTTREKMIEYQELVTAFHSEQQSHGEIDGEEMISREDILWLLSELKLRFEDILNSWLKEEDEERLRKQNECQSDNTEFKECIEGLVGIVKKITPHDKPNGMEYLGNDKDEIVSSLNHRLASFAAQHKDTCQSLHDDMEAMKRNYQEQLANKSACIKTLDSKIVDQQEYITQLQKERQDKQWIIEEKRRLQLKEEGMVQRIRYLEGMLHSSQSQLKESRYKSSDSSGGTQISPPPVFMRDLHATMQDVDLKENAETSANHIHYETTPNNNLTELDRLQKQVVTLSCALADSETQRATLIEEFQEERKQYMNQYKQISEVVKELVGGHTLT